MSVDRGREGSESQELGLRESSPQSDVQEISESRAERDDARTDPANWERLDLSREPDAGEHLPAQKPWTAEEKAAIDSAAAVYRLDSPGAETTPAGHGAETRDGLAATEHPDASTSASATSLDAGSHAADESAATMHAREDAEPAGRHAGESGELSAPTDDPGEGTDSGENRDTGIRSAAQPGEAGQPAKYVVVLDDARSNPSFDPGSNTWSDRQHGEYAVIRPGETPPPEVLRADRPLYTYDKPVTTDYSPHVPPTAEDRYLVRDQANPVPLFDGPPIREQTAQGHLGDCGIVSTLGAAAAYRPEAIQNAIKQTGDGKYEVTLHVVRPATPLNPVSRPTADTVTYKMNDELPVRTDDARKPLAGMKADTCAWPALMEKTVASQDQSWDAKQYANWDQKWANQLKPAVDAERLNNGLPPSPNDSPMGYNRIDAGATPHQCADLLAELTGEQAEVRTMPDEQQGEQALLDEFRDRIADGKPVLVGTRANRLGETEPLPPDVFAFGHAYEVTKVDGNKISLRNPWGDWGNPPPMDVKTFWEYYRQYNHDGSRTGYYTTLK